MRQVFAQGEKAGRRQPLGGPPEDEGAHDVRREIGQSHLRRQIVPLDAEALRHGVDGLVASRQQGIAGRVRVAQQGDLRPMAASKEAMDDLRRILSGRAAFYSKAEFRLDTSTQPLEPTFLALRKLVRDALGLAA